MTDDNWGKEAPFHNGYCWQYPGEIIEEFGYCKNPDCVDPEADQETRSKYKLPSGKYWGSSIKSTTCTCGWRVSLT
jgi:hypothetical protein